MKTMAAAHRNAPAAVILALGLLMAGCATTSSTGQATGGSPSPAPPACDPIYRALNFTPSQQQQAETGGSCVPEDLTLTGEVTSHVQVGVRLVTIQSCTISSNRTITGTAFNFVQGAQVYQLVLEPNAATSGGPQDVPFDPNYRYRVWLTDAASLGNSIWTQQSGTIHVNADAQSGTVDAILARDQPGAGQVHVTGSWRCGT